MTAAAFTKLNDAVSSVFSKYSVNANAKFASKFDQIPKKSDLQLLVSNINVLVDQLKGSAHTLQKDVFRLINKAVMLFVVKVKESYLNTAISSTSSISNKSAAVDNIDHAFFPEAVGIPFSPIVQTAAGTNVNVASGAGNQSQGVAQPTSTDIDSVTGLSRGSGANSWQKTMANVFVLLSSLQSEIHQMLQSHLDGFHASEQYNRDPSSNVYGHSNADITQSDSSQTKRDMISYQAVEEFMNQSLCILQDALDEIGLAVQKSVLHHVRLTLFNSYIFDDFSVTCSVHNNNTVSSAKADKKALTVGVSGAPLQLQQHTIVKQCSKYIITLQRLVLYYFNTVLPLFKPTQISKIDVHSYQRRCSSTLGINHDHAGTHAGMVSSSDSAQFNSMPSLWSATSKTNNDESACQSFAQRTCMEVAHRIVDWFSILTCLVYPLHSKGKRNIINDIDVLKQNVLYPLLFPFNYAVFFAHAPSDVVHHSMFSQSEVAHPVLRRLEVLERLLLVQHPSEFESFVDASVMQKIKKDLNVNVDHDTDLRKMKLSDQSNVFDKVDLIHFLLSCATSAAFPFSCSPPDVLGTYLLLSFYSMWFAVI
jgi:hypothetical protein